MGEVYFLTSIPEHLFNLKFAAKDLERNAKKSEKGEKEEKTKLKKVSHKVDIRYLDIILVHTDVCQPHFKWFQSSDYRI